MAPILIHTAQYDVLAIDGEKLRDKLVKENGDVVYKKWNKMWHLFHTHFKDLSESKAAMDECKMFLNENYSLANNNYSVM